MIEDLTKVKEDDVVAWDPETVVGASEMKVLYRVESIDSGLRMFYMQNLVTSEFRVYSGSKMKHRAWKRAEDCEGICPKCNRAFVDEDDYLCERCRHGISDES